MNRNFWLLLILVLSLGFAPACEYGSDDDNGNDDELAATLVGSWDHFAPASAPQPSLHFHFDSDDTFEFVTYGVVYTFEFLPGSTHSLQRDMDDRVYESIGIDGTGANDDNDEIDVGEQFEYTHANGRDVLVFDTLERARIEVRDDQDVLESEVLLNVEIDANQDVQSFIRVEGEYAVDDDILTTWQTSNTSVEFYQITGSAPDWTLSFGLYQYDTDYSGSSEPTLEEGSPWTVEQTYPIDGYSRLERLSFDDGTLSRQRIIFRESGEREFTDRTTLRTYTTLSANELAVTTQTETRLEPAGNDTFRTFEDIGRIMPEFDTTSTLIFSTNEFTSNNTGLVGTWTDGDDEMVFHADGTYTYDGDAPTGFTEGTWAQDPAGGYRLEFSARLERQTE